MRLNFATKWQENRPPGAPIPADRRSKIVKPGWEGKDDGTAQPSEDPRSAKLAAGKAISILSRLEEEGYCGLETTSVYGAAVAMPQIARSSGWSGTLTAMAFRSYFFLALNIMLQAFLLSMIGMEQLVMYPFAGKMHLCNFAADVPSCPDGPDCQGPGGTTFSYPRLYDFDIWSTRAFVKSSLQSLFPHRTGEVDELVDPGEYGVENTWCRMACVLLFMMAVVDDLRGSMRLAFLLWKIPARADSWIDYEEPARIAPQMSKQDVKAMLDLTELDLVKFRVAGMPRGWKIVNFFIVFVPKLAIWFALVLSGVHYLMETAGIMNVIINAMALNFVLDVDEMIFARVCTLITQHIMLHLEDLPLFTTEDLEVEGEDEVMEKYQKEELGSGFWSRMKFVFPKVFAMLVTMQVFFMYYYFRRNCLLTEDGSWVSRPMHLPDSQEYNLLGLMFGVEGSMEPKPFWTMQGPED